jgi:hypothetical protein
VRSTSRGAFFEGQMAGERRRGIPGTVEIHARRAPRPKPADRGEPTGRGERGAPTDADRRPPQRSSTTPTAASSQLPGGPGSHWEPGGALFKARVARGARGVGERGAPEAGGPEYRSCSQSHSQPPAGSGTRDSGKRGMPRAPGSARRKRKGGARRKTSRPQDAPPRLDQRLFLWALYVLGQDRNEVWWPTDLVSGYKRGPECRINSTCT